MYTYYVGRCRPRLVLKKLSALLFFLSVTIINYVVLNYHRTFVNTCKCANQNCFPLSLSTGANEEIVAHRLMTSSEIELWWDFFFTRVTNKTFSFFFSGKLYKRRVPAFVPCSKTDKAAPARLHDTNIAVDVRSVV